MRTRRTYTPIRVDMTPFVSIALLLIVFFVWQKERKRPAMLGVTIPAGCHKYGSPVYPRKVIFLYLLDKDRVGVMQYWHGDDIAELQTTQYGPYALRRMLAVAARSAKGDAAVVIKPTQYATFRNVVQALNELKIAGNLPYLFISELVPNERLMLQHYEQTFLQNQPLKETVYLRINPYYAQIGRL